MVEATVLVAFLLVAFAGGAFGAAVGGLPAYGLAGLVVVAGEVATLGTEAGATAGHPVTVGTTGITASIGFGPVLGPHVAFGGGVAAAAYAARKGHLDTGFRYHEAKHVTEALGAAPGVLVAGGAFGVVGYLLAALSAGGLPGLLALPWPGLPWDPVSFAIVVSALLHRVAFGYPLLGNLRSDPLDMSPFERGDRRRPISERRPDGGTRPETGTETAAGTGDGGDTGASDTRFVVEPWLPHQYEWASVAMLGAVVGALSAFVTHQTASPYLAFGIAAASLLLLSLGLERLPVTHHMALPSGLAVAGLAGGAGTPEAMAAQVGLLVAVLVGGVFGVVSGLAAELAQRVLYAHADTHLDPPAVGILAGTFLVAVLTVAGVFSQGAIPTFGL